MKIAVIGASGFVGSTLVERLLRQERGEVIPFVHTTGNAAQIARLGVGLNVLNLLAREQVKEALAGCTHVVNCSRGGEDVMLTGLRNLLAACRHAKVQRFIHLSSVAVYGDPPSADSAVEDGRAEPARGSYGWIKLEQDRMVAKAATRGLSCVALCPPNISGPGSPYLDAIVAALARGELALLEAGCAPCCLVDVCNLSRAIELALDRGPDDGQRMFVTDDEPLTWADVIAELRPLTGERPPAPGIGKADLLRLAAPPPKPRISLARSVLHLASSDVREAMRKDPLWEKVDSALRNAVRVLGSTVEDHVRLMMTETPNASRDRDAIRINVRLTAQQLRDVRHRCDRAKQLLGYRPLYTSRSSFAAFRRSFIGLRGWDTPAAPLLRQH